MNDLDISVIIVNYNVKHFLENCLLSVIKACKMIRSEIIVFDNCSTDGSRSYFDNRFSEVRFIWYSENIGFARANNTALQSARGEFVLFLNPDTLLAEDTIEQCLRFIGLNKQCGALGVKMIDGSGYFLKESKRSFPTVINAFWRLTGIDRLFPASRFFSSYYASHIPENENARIEVLPGAFMFVRHKVLQTTGSFDEAFFMFGEDIDLSYRINQAGFETVYFPGTAIIHFKGESTQKSSASYNRNFYGAMRLFVTKHYKLPQALAMNAVIGVASFFSSIKNRTRFLEKRRSLVTAIIASQDRFVKVINILKHAPQPAIIKGRIAIQDSDLQNQIGSVRALEAIIKHNQLEQLVCCEGDLSNREIISLMEKLSGEINFLIHEQQAYSIVGSANKDKKGTTIAP